MQEQRVQTLTDSAYWDRTWSGRPVPEPLNPHAAGLNGTVPHLWHQFFRQTFQSLGFRPGDLVLEAGCGGSVFLPYFAKEYGLVAEGIDNSPEGCELSNAIAQRSGIPTMIHAGDVLRPPGSLRGRYKAVFSLGLAEHFSPTASIVTALAALLQPAGYLITIVPNMHGLIGLLQRLVDPSVYRVHVPLSPAELADAHRACGLTICNAAHLMTVNFSVVNFSGPGSRLPSRLGLRFASWASKLVWSLQRLGLPETPNGWTSPYVVVVAQRTHGTRVEPV